MWAGSAVASRGSQKSTDGDAKSARNNCSHPDRLLLLGLVTSYTGGGPIHILLVIAIVVVIVRVTQQRSP